MSNEPTSDRKIALHYKVHDADNVAIVVNDQGLPAGTCFEDGLQLIEHVPQGHKVALNDIAQHGAILCYGEVIGTALRPIAHGSWIEESLVALLEAPPLSSLPLANNVPPALPLLEGYTLEGYRNVDGSVGTRNLLSITTSVHCVAGVVEKALGSIAKSGRSPIVEVLSPGQRPTKRGLIYAATPTSDFVCGTQQMASGITLQVFTAERGTPVWPSGNSGDQDGNAQGGGESLT